MKSQKSLLQQKKPKFVWPVQARQVNGHSMMPVLPPGTMVFGWRWFRKLKPGDIVIFHHEGKEKIKRIKEKEENRIFVVGDHEAASTDSREFGWVDIAQVQARTIWPRAPKHRAEGVEKEY